MPDPAPHSDRAPAPKRRADGKCGEESEVSAAHIQPSIPRGQTHVGLTGIVPIAGARSQITALVPLPSRIPISANGFPRTRVRITVRASGPGQLPLAAQLVHVHRRAALRQRHVPTFSAFNRSPIRFAWNGNDSSMRYALANGVGIEAIRRQVRDVRVDRPGVELAAQVADEPGADDGRVGIVQVRRAAGRVRRPRPGRPRTG